MGIAEVLTIVFVVVGRFITSHTLIQFVCHCGSNKAYDGPYCGNRC